MWMNVKIKLWIDWNNLPRRTSVWMTIPDLAQWVLSITPGLRIIEAYTDINFYSQQFSINSILSQQCNPELVILITEILFPFNLPSVCVSFLVHFCALFWRYVMGSFLWSLLWLELLELEDLVWDVVLPWVILN